VTVRVGRFEAGFFVADDGVGIPESDWATVFEPGYTTSDAGTGLGLAIVQQIAEAHGWNVAVCASDTGGTRFEVSGVEFLDSG
jgi:two-component system sensor histidine kinase HydH